MTVDHMEVPLFREILIIFALSMGVLLFCHRLHLPSIVGFLLTGVLCGPHGLGLVDDLHDVQKLAEIGIVLLLFTVGMEFSLKKIVKFKRFFFGAGALQVLMTSLAGFGVAWLWGMSIADSLFLGFLLTLSSTAVVLRLLEEKGTTDTPHGRLIVGTLIFQDIAVVPMMLSIPLLASRAPMDATLLWILGKGFLILAAVFICAERVVPYFLYMIARTRSRELFLLGVFLVCFSVTLLVSSFGLSVSIGAFLAGLTLADTDYRNRAIDDILPFKDIFTSFFFVSIGMLLDFGFITNHPLPILILAVGVILAKGTIMAGVGLAIGMPLRTSALAALALAQVGEFSFVLAETGTALGLGSVTQYQYFLAVAILSMAVAPILFDIAPRIVTALLRLPVPSKLKMGISPIKEVAEEQLENHLIIVGYGLIGKNLARSCEEAAIPYTVLEMDATIVRKGRQKGMPIHYGDATHDLALHHTNVTKAQSIVVVIHDTLGTYKIIEAAKRLNPNIYVIARTNYLEDMKALFQVGADDVIVDEFGSAIEIFTRVLQKYCVAEEQIEKLVHEMRSEGYEMERLHYKESAAFLNLKLNQPHSEVSSILLRSSSSLVGKTLLEAAIRQNYGVNVIAIERDSEPLRHFDAHTRLTAGDLLVVMGSAEGIEKLRGA